MALTGKELKAVWIDEYHSNTHQTIRTFIENEIQKTLGDKWAQRANSAIDSDIARVFSHPDYPGARVEVVKMTADGYDSRNPNPHAGKRKFWVVKLGKERVNQEYSSFGAAVLRARMLHDKMVAGLKEAEEKLLESRRSKNPNYGRF